MREFSTEVIGERQYREIEIVLARHGQGRSLALPDMQRTRPYYLQLYHRLITPARASASLQRAAVLPIE